MERERARRKAELEAAGKAPVVRIRYRKPQDKRSRPQRWRDAVAELVDLQADYAAWLDALPDSLRDSAASRKRPALKRPSASRCAASNAERPPLSSKSVRLSAWGFLRCGHPACRLLSRNLRIMQSFPAIDIIGLFLCIS